MILDNGLLKIKSLVNKIQRRLLNSHFFLDYLVATVIGLIPIVVAVLTDIWEPVLKKDDTSFEFQRTGFSEAYNCLSLAVSFPISLFLLRKSCNLMFGINENKHLEKVPLLKKFNKEVRVEIHKQLQYTVLNPILPLTIFFLDLVFHYFDLKELFNQYILGFLGKQPVVETYIYWANLWIVKPDKIPITTNFILTLIVYFIQFIVIFIALTAIATSLLYNIFYIRKIYQRSRAKQAKEYYIVIDLEDSERAFGLKDLNEAFNIQLINLIIAGLLTLFSRLVIVPESKRFDIQYILHDIDINEFLKVLPEFGQWMIVASWLFAFLIVIIPSFVKFLPILSGVNLSNLKITTYLREFIPPENENGKYNLNNEKNVDKVASRFARNSFWPIGDDMARFLFYFVFIVAFTIIFPLKLKFWNIFFIIILGISLGTIILDIYKWLLGHVDERLVYKVRGSMMPQESSSIRIVSRGDIINPIVNLGELNGNVSNVVNQLPSSPDPTQPGIKELLSKLQQVVNEDTHLDPEDKEDLLEQVKVFAEAGQTSNQEEKKGLVRKAKKMFDATLGSLPATANIVEACSKLLPLILKALGLQV